MSSVIVDGRTPRQGLRPGTRVRIVQNGEHPLDVRIWVGEEEVPMTKRPRLLRDGGTRHFTAAAGEICIPNRLGEENQIPTLDGDPIQ